MENKYHSVLSGPVQTVSISFSLRVIMLLQTSTAMSIEPVCIEPMSIEPVCIEPVYIEPVCIEPVYIEPVYIEPVCFITTPLNWTCNLAIAVVIH